MTRSWKLAVAGIAVVGFVCVCGTNLSAAEESPAVQGDKKDGDAGKAAPGGKGQARGKREGKGGAPADPKKAAEMRKAAFLRQNPEADLDKDGKLSEEEELKSRQAKIEAFLKGHPEIDRKKVDTNGDGKISLEEATGFSNKNADFRRDQEAANLLKRYPEADTNKDGKLSKEELQEFQKNRKKAGPPPGGKRGEGKKGEGKKPGGEKKPSE